MKDKTHIFGMYQRAGTHKKIHHTFLKPGDVWWKMAQLGGIRPPRGGSKGIFQYSRKYPTILVHFYVEGKTFSLAGRGRSPAAGVPSVLAALAHEQYPRYCSDMGVL
jgi:hypothetical protein